MKDTAMRLNRYSAVPVTFIVMILAMPAFGGDKYDQVQLIDGKIHVPPPLFTLAERAETDRPCGPGVDNRNSDLCAQWKAADAAKASAEYTWYTFLVSLGASLIGLFTLGSALLAANYAKAAALETRRGADAANAAVLETRRIGEAQVRAYVHCEELKLDWSVHDEINFITCIWKNTGQSPASDVAARVMVTTFHNPVDEPLFDHKMMREHERIASATVSRSVISPGGTLKNLTQNFTREQVLDLRTKRIVCFVHGYVVYRDVFRKRRYGRFCLKLEPRETGNRHDLHFARLPFGNTAS